MNYKMQHEEYIHTVPNSFTRKYHLLQENNNINVDGFHSNCCKIEKLRKKMGGNVNFRGAVRS